LIEIDPATGAGTPVGAAGWGLGAGSCYVNNITLNSLGEMYGWSEGGGCGFDDLVRIDKTTGIATVIPSSLGTSRFGLAFDNTDTLYLVSWDGYYIVNTSNGTWTLEGNIGIAHHGDFHPTTNLYYGLNPGGFGVVGVPRSLIEADLATGTASTVGSTGSLDDMHTLAFVPADEPTPTPTTIPTNTPVPTPVPQSVGGVAVGEVSGTGAQEAVTPEAGSGVSYLALLVSIAIGVALSGAAYWAARRP
jgi:hypothetical protein